MFNIGNPPDAEGGVKRTQHPRTLNSLFFH